MAAYVKDVIGMYAGGMFACLKDTRKVYSAEGLLDSAAGVVGWRSDSQRV